jgi:nucleoside-diphosphate-sugar epimerase
MAKKLLITGGQGIIGHRMVPRFLDAGYEVTSVGLERWVDAPCPHIICDLREFGVAVDVIASKDAVVHLAAVHRQGVAPPAETFNANIVSTFNVFHAAATLGVRKVVWASSTHTGGGHFNAEYPPAALPLREGEPHQVEGSYGLSKIAGEALMRHPRALRGLEIISLRYGYVYEAEHYPAIRKLWEDPAGNGRNLWNYLDGRDAFAITRAAVESTTAAGEIFNVTAADSIMNMPSPELAARYFPQAKVRPELTGFASFYSIEKARNLLGYQPQHSWRDVLTT